MHVTVVSTLLLVVATAAASSQAHCKCEGQYDQCEIDCPEGKAAKCYKEHKDCVCKCVEMQHDKDTNDYACCRYNLSPTQPCGPQCVPWLSACPAISGCTLRSVQRVQDCRFCRGASDKDAEGLTEPSPASTSDEPAQAPDEPVSTPNDISLSDVTCSCMTPVQACTISCPIKAVCKKQGPHGCECHCEIQDPASDAGCTCQSKHNYCEVDCPQGKTANCYKSLDEVCHCECL